MDLFHLLHAFLFDLPRVHVEGAEDLRNSEISLTFAFGAFPWKITGKFNEIPMHLIGKVGEKSYNLSGSVKETITYGLWL